MHNNPELEQIYADDQSDRNGEMPDDIYERDRARLARVEELLDSGAVRSAGDHVHAAFVFQHGSRLEHYWQAHELAMQAASLGHGHPAPWLAAAAYDRWLMHQGLAQKFGTQYRMSGAGWVLHEVDPATTDAERARWDVPPLAEAKARAERMNQPVAALPRSQADPANTLDVLDQPMLRVAMVAIGAEEAVFMPEAMPIAVPLSADEPHPLPSELPAMLSPRRLGEGYCAVDSAEMLVVSWFALSLLADQTLYLAWNLADGPPPALESLNLDGRPAAFVAAAWSAVSAERLPLLVVRAGPDSCWLVGGRLGRDELGRIAASLPWMSGTYD